ncbi:Hsp70 family protein [bacterium]|nr:Hsp70 family protein [bacterium]
MKIANLLRGAGARKSKQPIRVIGIDLGTTNSTVAEVVFNPKDEEEAAARCVEIDQGTLEGRYTHSLVPSVVAVHDGQLFVGEGAKRLRGKAADPDYGLARNRNIFWDCKNDMGLDKTYHRAPDGFQSAKDIASKVLAFLKTQSSSDQDEPVARTVITVPASFQAAQRQDTLDAARLAGYDVRGGDLLDEPIAAFLDYVLTHDLSTILEPGETKNLLVFDFGGGTCDVAIFRIGIAEDEAMLEISPLSVSRYHRLGGGDIDSSILYEVLIPQIIEQNGLCAHDLDFDTKKNQLEPAFLSLAESLKIGLCSEIRTLKRFGKYDEARKSETFKIQPGVHTCKLPNGRELRIQSPRLSAIQLDTVLTPFLDSDFVFHRESEYRMTCSIFAPLADGLDRASLTSDDIDLCLLVGGSCLIPQVVEAVSEYFGLAEVLSYDSQDDIQTAVAKGAAYHALMLEMCGHGLVRPVCAESVSIKTADEPLELIPRGARLPYPAEGEWSENDSLVVPKGSSRSPLQLHVELVGEKGQSLFSGVWNMETRPTQGERLVLQYHMDENQIINLRIDTQSNQGHQGFDATIENPLSNIVNPNSKKIRIDELEEQMRSKKMSQAKQEEVVMEIAGLCSELGQRDKSMHLYSQMLRVRGGQDEEILNKMGLLAGEMGDYNREEKFLRESARFANWGGPLFNLALSYRSRGLLDKAAKAIDEALDVQVAPAYLVLKAQIADSMKEAKTRDQSLEMAFELFQSVETMTEWELLWYERASRMKNDAKRIAEVDRTRKSRKLKTQALGVTGELPERAHKEDRQ